MPRPHIAFLLDANPEEARARKPEYPLDFLFMNRESYLALGRIVGTMTIAPALPIKHVAEIVVQRTFESLSR